MPRLADETRMARATLNSKGKQLKPLGGGGVGGTSTPGQDLGTSAPLGGKSRGWRIAVGNNFAFSLSAQVFAVCGSVKGWRPCGARRWPTPPARRRSPTPPAWRASSRSAEGSLQLDEHAGQPGLDAP
jgi:hypothetical protein